MHVLILGGTTEASALARALADDRRFRVTLSLAGRTREPAPQPVPVRTGGFGGAAGLEAFLREQHVDALIDATHPFAAQITRNALAAAAVSGTPLLAVHRPEWRQAAGDRWREVGTMAAAAAALGQAPRRVLLTVGQKDLAPFVAAKQHCYVLRSVDPPPAPPAGALLLTARGPFAEADELTLLRDHRIEVVVTKNSGGTATAAKLAAARALGLEVVMVTRPALPPGLATVPTAAAALAWLDAHWRTRRGE